MKGIVHILLTGEQKVVKVNTYITHDFLALASEKAFNHVKFITQLHHHPSQTLEILNICILDYPQHLINSLVTILLSYTAAFTCRLLQMSNNKYVPMFFFFKSSTSIGNNMIMENYFALSSKFTNTFALDNS